MTVILATVLPMVKGEQTWYLQAIAACSIVIGFWLGLGIHKKTGT